jgi:hypothetical protein
LNERLSWESNTALSLASQSGANSRSASMAPSRRPPHSLQGTAAAMIMAGLA